MMQGSDQAGRDGRQELETALRSVFEEPARFEAFAWRVPPQRGPELARGVVRLLRSPADARRPTALAGAFAIRASLLRGLAAALARSEAAAAVAAVEAGWQAASGAPPGPQDVAEWLDRLASRSTFSTAAAAARALGAWLVALRLAGRDAPAVLEALTRDVEVLTGRGGGGAHRHRSVLAALGALTRSPDDTTAKVARDAVEACLARAPEKPGAPWPLEPLSVVFGLADGPCAVDRLGELVPRLARSRDALAVGSCLDVVGDLSARPADARPPGCSEAALAGWLGDIPTRIAEALEQAGERGDTRGTLRWLHVLRRLRGLDAAAETAPGEGVGAWLVRELLGAGEAPPPEGLEAPVAAWLRLWVATSRCFAAEDAGGALRAAQPMDVLAAEAGDPHLVAAARALGWLGPAAAGAFVAARVEVLEAAVASLGAGPEGFLRHPSRLMDAARLATLQDIARAAAAAAARAAPTSARRSRRGPTLLERRLGHVVRAVLALVLEELGRLGDDAAVHRERASPYYAVLYDVVEHLVEDRPDLWPELLRVGEPGEPALVAHPALERGLFGIIEHRAADAKHPADFADFCLEWLVDRETGSGRGHTRLGLSLRLLHRLHQHEADAPIWTRLAGRAASRDVTRPLAALYESGLEPRDNAATTVQALAQGQAGDPYVRAWLGALECGDPSALDGGREAELREDVVLGVPATREALRGVPASRRPGLLAVLRWGGGDAVRLAAIVCPNGAAGRGAGTGPALAALREAAVCAVRLAGMARWPDLEAQWREVLGDRLLHDLPAAQGDDDGFELAAEELPFEGAVGRLRELRDLAARAERALEALREALGPSLGPTWAHDTLGSGDGGVLARLAAPWLEVRALVADPSPAMAHGLLGDGEPRGGGTPSGRWPGHMRQRLAYEVLIRGFAPVEALLGAPFGKGLVRALARLAGALYAFPVQGAALMAFAFVWGFIPSRPPTGSAMAASGSGALPACAIEPLPALPPLLLLPALAALLPPLLLGLATACSAVRRQRFPVLAGRLAFPRLWAANLIGITFIAMSDEGWTQMLQARGAGLLATALFLAIALLYIVFEVQRASGSPRRRRHARALGSTLPRAAGLALIALNQCATLAAAAQLYAGRALLPRLAGPDGPGPAALAACFDTPFGRLYPSALAAWTVGALFFGLLIQVLWEDRPLSEGVH